MGNGPGGSKFALFFLSRHLFVFSPISDVFRGTAVVSARFHLKKKNFTSHQFGVQRAHMCV